MGFMEIEVKRTIYIDLDEIIEENHLTKETPRELIRAGVKDYVSGLDDCDYYALDADHITAITDEVEKTLRDEPTAKDWDDFWHNL